MRICLIHGDTNPWATSNRADEFKKRWTNDEVDIIPVNPAINIDKYDATHILFSGGITQLKKLVLDNPNKIHTTLASQRTLDCNYDKREDLIEVYRNSNKIVCQNRTLMANLVNMIGKEYAEKMVYIPNGVDEKVFDKKFVVGYVGTDQAYHHEYKGLPLVKQACEELGLELKLTHNNYPDKIIPHEQMPDFYRQIDCLIIPSLGEGCNNPTMEALAMNIPVISTRVGIAEDLEGVTIVERNVESIKGAIRKISGRIQILEKYTWDIIAKQYHDLYVGK